MNILYCGDVHVEKGLVLSALSLANHIEESEQLHIYILTMDMELHEKKYEPIHAKLAESLQDYLARSHPGSTVEIYDIAALFAKEQPGVNLNTRFTPYCMLRLYADEIEAIPDKILYLDTDVLCRKNPMNFYNQDISDKEMAGVLDNIGRWFFHRSFLHQDYFNSGVLLLNMKNIRKSGLFYRSRRMCMEKKMFMPDQSALNKEVQSMTYCDRMYNEQGILQPDTVFQHFTTSFSFCPIFHLITVKPWQYDDVHSVLKLNEYDSLFAEADRFMEQFQTRLEESKHEPRKSE